MADRWSRAPIRPEDEPLEHELIAGLSPESSRFRFFYIIKDITHDMLSRYLQYRLRAGDGDYRRIYRQR